MAKNGLPAQSSSSSSVVYLLVGATVLPFAAAIGQFVMEADNKHLSSAQRNQDGMVFVAMGLCAALGLAAYFHFSKAPSAIKDDKKAKSDSDKSTTASKTDTSRPKDIWKVGQNSQTSLKKPKAAYTEKPFGSKYYYAHNDSNTTGGYKDGLKMEDYRMNGPRLLSVNGQSIVDKGENDPFDHGINEQAAASNESAPTRITLQDPSVKNITKYLWDDPGNVKGIATIRVDVLPGDRFGEFINISDVTIDDVQASLPGEGLLAKIATTSGAGDIQHYQLKINKLYGDAADVKVVIKPKRLLIKIHKKKHGFLSGNSDNMGAWPQPHRKV